MEINPHKCHSISLTRLRNPTTHTYILLTSSDPTRKITISKIFRSHSVGKALMVRTRNKHSKQSKSCPRNVRKKYKCCSYASQVTTLIQPDLGWSLLFARHEQARLIGLLMFKLCHSLVNVNSSKTLIPITRPTRLSHPRRPIAETCSCQKTPSGFFLPKINNPMEQPARHPGMHTHRWCLHLCFKDR